MPHGDVVLNTGRLAFASSAIVAMTYQFSATTLATPTVSASGSRVALNQSRKEASPRSFSRDRPSDAYEPSETNLRRRRVPLVARVLVPIATAHSATLQA